jgi:hypothetical protein
MYWLGCRGTSLETFRVTSFVRDWSLCVSREKTVLLYICGASSGRKSLVYGLLGLVGRVRNEIPHTKSIPNVQIRTLNAALKSHYRAHR